MQGTPFFRHKGISTSRTILLDSIYASNTEQKINASEYSFPHSSDKYDGLKSINSKIFRKTVQQSQHPTMRQQRGTFTLGTQLKIVADFKNGRTIADLSTELNVTESVIQSVLNRKPSLEKVQKKPGTRHHLSLGDKLRVLHFLETGVPPVQIRNQFGISTRTLYRIKSNKAKYIGMDTNRVSTSTPGSLHAKYPELEARVTAFISFARDKRMPVSMHLIQERARMIANQLGIQSFHASNGWLDRFIRRSSVQPSFKLRGKGNALLPTSHSEAMTQLRAISALYEPANIRSMDEFSLFFRMGPRQSYLSNKEAVCNPVQILPHSNLLSVSQKHSTLLVMSTLSNP